ncbi:hypothetical protein SCUCBS95973_006824 [Sporothrix curviconia]|uniref:Ubiquitin-like protease family profile domain-containing protein n=1 Tax=Sporothrix curviconia TaxID=1260050 RepID=A0ABP0C8E0_9PEZI
MAIDALLTTAQKLLDSLFGSRQPGTSVLQIDRDLDVDHPAAQTLTAPIPIPPPATETLRRSGLSWTQRSLNWLRATTAAMRPDTLKELFWNGFSFISERLLHHTTHPDNDDFRDNTPVTVDRIKPPSSSAHTAHNVSPFSQDYELVWRENPVDYISPAGFESIASLLRAWKDDIEAGHVVRCPSPQPIVRRFDDGSHSETRLSVVVHNFMFERAGRNTEQAWKDAVVEFLKAIEATERWISGLYAPESFEAMKAQGIVSYEDLKASAQQFWDSRCGLCAVGDFLVFAIHETHQWGHPGMHLSQLSLMKLLVDLEAFHRQQPILSFVLVERQSRAPGYLYDDEDGAVEPVAAEELRSLWLGSRTGAAVSSRESHTSLPCRVYGKSSLNVRTQESLRKSRIVNAAAASLKASRRLANGSGSLLVSPSRSLLSERYRSTTRDCSHRMKLDALPFIKDYQITAKRKATTATPDLRQFKRSRLEKATRTDARKAKAEAEAAAAVAASVPLPPSPAATESTSDEEVDIESAAAVEDAFRQQRLPWATIFPEDDDDEESTFPRLRISTAKADELRLIAEKKRATQEAARLKREAEIRRKEEDRRHKEEEELARKSGLRQPSRKVIVSLSDSWHSRVNAAICADPNKDIAKSPEGTALRRNDFKTVVSKSEWLNDEIVNGFLLHLANYINRKAGITNPKTQTPKCHAFTSFFWKPLSTKGAAGTERWMKRVGVTKDNFLKIDTILIPICESSHWTLVVVRPGRATITHMDSLGSRGAGRPAVTNIVMRWVKDLLKDSFSGKWRVQHYDSPRQTNGWDCGVHTITNALFLSLGLDPSFYGAVDMPLQRDRIAATLINGGFSGELDLSGL